MVMSEESTFAQEPDVYGQVHPEETPELVQTKLSECEAKLPSTPNILKAKEKGLHTKDFLLQFLRCEVFHTELAVQRYVRYWDMRVETFGPDLAFRRFDP